MKWRSNKLQRLLDNIDNIIKSGKVGTVPLNITALQILTDRERNKTIEYVFTYKGEQIQQNFITKKFKKYVIKAELNKKLKFHSLDTLRQAGFCKEGVQSIMFRKYCIIQIIK